MIRGERILIGYDHRLNDAARKMQDGGEHEGERDGK